MADIRSVRRSNSIISLTKKKRQKVPVLETTRTFRLLVYPTIFPAVCKVKNKECWGEPNLPITLRISESGNPFTHVSLCFTMAVSWRQIHKLKNAFVVVLVCKQEEQIGIKIILLSIWNGSLLLSAYF